MDIALIRILLGSQGAGKDYVSILILMDIALILFFQHNWMKI